MSSRNMLVRPHEIERKACTTSMEILGCALRPCLSSRGHVSAPPQAREDLQNVLNRHMGSTQPLLIHSFSGDEDDVQAWILPKAHFGLDKKCPQHVWWVFCPWIKLWLKAMRRFSAVILLKFALPSPPNWTFLLHVWPSLPWTTLGVSSGSYKWGTED